jgi:hypothetical protein
LIGAPDYFGILVAAYQNTVMWRPHVGRLLALPKVSREGEVLLNSASEIFAGIFLALGSVTTYARFIYPELGATYGGGHKVPVILVMNEKGNDVAVLAHLPGQDGHTFGPTVPDERSPTFHTVPDSSMKSLGRVAASLATRRPHRAVSGKCCRRVSGDVLFNVFPDLGDHDGAFAHR